MADLIDRQAAIDALNGQISVTGDINTKAVQNYIRMVNQRLHDLPSAQPERCEDCGNFNKTRLLIPHPEQRWIPVSERLPEEGKQVLVCDDGGFIYTAEGETRSDGEWQWYESVEYRPMEDVVAWMLLPEPYKGEDGEEG